MTRLLIKGLGVFSAEDRAKLDGIQSGATANASDAALRDRATHTGTQPIATVQGLPEALEELSGPALTVIDGGSFF